MAEPVRARRLTDQEGQRLQQIVRRGKHESVRVRRAMIIMASASGTLVPAIARLVAADEDTVRPGGYRLFIIMGNLAADKTPAIRRGAAAGERRAVLHAHQRVVGQPDRATRSRM